MLALTTIDSAAIGYRRGAGLGGMSADSVIQGILVTGAAVYGNQLVKQLGKKD